MTSRDWEPAFLAVSFLLGEPLEATVACLGGEETGREKPLPELAAVLRAAPREVRAAAVAREVARVARDLEGLRINGLGAE
jgi:hypothetical protein